MDHLFQLLGTAEPLRKASAGVEGHEPSRALGGWATTYGKLGPDGQVIPTWDRDDQVMDAARELEGIDWSTYLRGGGGFWNDTHIGGRAGDRQIKVGIGTALGFHGPGSELAQDHGKVGWWTAGHLWDRNDPNSWSLYTDYRPTPQDLDRADYFWDLATGPLRGADRTLGFSVDGLMRTSPCRRRIIWAAVQEVALAVGPANPDCTVEVLHKAQGVAQGFDFLRPGLIGADALPAECGRCRCPPGVCGLARVASLKKSQGVQRHPVPREQVRPGSRPAAPPLLLSTHEARMETKTATPLDTALQQLDELGKGATAADPTLDALAEIEDLGKGGGDEPEEETEDEPSEESEMEKADEGDEPDDEEVAKAAEEVFEFMTGIDASLRRIEAANAELRKSVPDVSGLEIQVGALQKSVNGMQATIDRLSGSLAAVLRGIVTEQRSLAKSMRDLRPITASDTAVADLNAAALGNRIAAAPVPDNSQAENLHKSLSLALKAGKIDNREVLALQSLIAINPAEVERRLAHLNA